MRNSLRSPSISGSPVVEKRCPSCLQEQSVARMAVAGLCGWPFALGPPGFGLPGKTLFMVFR
jgi:hypothetical protein